MTAKSTWLSPIPGLHRRDPEHAYWLGDYRFPISITGVLSCLKSEFAMQRIMSTRATWEPRGNSAHKALELFLQSGALFSVAGSWSRYSDMIGEMDQLATGDWAGWVNPLITHERWARLQVIASERATCCLRRGVAGMFDCAYIDEQGRRIIADLKTLSPHGATYSTAPQLGGYMALEASHGLLYDAGQTIWCRDGETVFGSLLSRDECLTGWAGAWATWRARNPDHQATQLLA